MPETYVSVTDLMHSIDHARLDHPTTVKAFEVMRQLREWVEDRDGLSTTPTAWVAVSAGSVELSVGHTGVWSSEVDSEDELTFECCRDAYLKELSASCEPFAAEMKFTRLE